MEQPNFIVNKALFVLTGTYNDMSMRPYEPSLTGNIVDQLREVTRGGTQISPTIVAGVAESFIKPSANISAMVNIAEGWDTPRYRFILDITQKSSLGGPGVRKIIQGYTSHPGVSQATKSVDPNMGLFFNNVLTLRESQLSTPHGIVTQVSVSEANQILRGDFQPSFDLSTPDNSTWRLRPEEIFNAMGTLEMTDVYDTRASFTSPIVKSRRSNGTSSRYLSDILKAHNAVQNTQDFGDNIDHMDTMNGAVGMVKDDSVTADPFFNLLTRVASNFTNGGFITYGELSHAIPQMDHVAYFLTGDHVQKQQPQGNLMNETHLRGSTSDWVGSDLATMWATTLSHSIPAIMMDSLLSDVVFMATNKVLGGPGFDVRILDANGFVENLDLTQYINHFIERIKYEVLTGLSLRHGISFELTMRVDIVGETKISIRIENDPTIDFVTPSFCDGLFSPVITNNRDSVGNLAHDIQTLAGAINVTDISGYNSNHNLQHV